MSLDLPPPPFLRCLVLLLDPEPSPWFSLFETTLRWSLKKKKKKGIQLLPGGFSQHAGFSPVSDECARRWRHADGATTHSILQLDRVGRTQSGREAAVDIVFLDPGYLGVNGFLLNLGPLRCGGGCKELVGDGGQKGLSLKSDAEQSGKKALKRL